MDTNIFKIAKGFNRSRTFKALKKFSQDSYIKENDNERLYTKSNQPQDRASFIENKYCSCRRVLWNIQIHETISNVFFFCLFAKPIEISLAKPMADKVTFR